jgi:formate-dependent nitrite reductase membrane component NrfD
VGAVRPGRVGLLPVDDREPVGLAVDGDTLLIADLGRPRRFLNMLRVFKPTSAMSMGSWILAAYSTAAGAAGALEVIGWLPRLRRLADAAAGALGLPMATYTGVLIAITVCGGTAG